MSPSRAGLSHSLSWRIFSSARLGSWPFPFSSEISLCRLENRQNTRLFFYQVAKFFTLSLSRCNYEIIISKLVFSQFLAYRYMYHIWRYMNNTKIAMCYVYGTKTETEFRFSLPKPKPPFAILLLNFGTLPSLCHPNWFFHPRNCPFLTSDQDSSQGRIRSELIYEVTIDFHYYFKVFKSSNHHWFQGWKIDWVLKQPIW